MKGWRRPNSKSDLPDLGRLFADGSVRTGRDAVILAILGADGVNIGTAILQAAGCLMVRQCQNNTCPVGIATQDPKYREHIDQEAAQKVKNFLLYIARDTQEWMARLGVKSFAELKGRTDLLVDRREIHPAAYAEHIKNVDLSSLLQVPQPPANIHEIRASRAAHTSLSVDLDQKLWGQIKSRASNDNVEPIKLEADVKNTDLSVGTLISSEIARQRMAGKGAPSVDITLKGYVGQSFGAFVANGISLNLQGEANDYVGEGLGRGGRIVIQNPANQNKAPSLVAGQAGLYGATGGEVYVDGLVGGRWAVRNSGAEGVVMGAGKWASEYMTDGFMVYLGSVGPGAFAGNSGGINLVYDPKKSVGNSLGSTMKNDRKSGLPLNFDTAGRKILRLDGPLPHDEGYAEHARDLIQNFFDETRNPLAGRILGDWEKQMGNFWIVIPNQYATARQNLITRERSKDAAFAAGD
jgi:glutamate synthase (NADPH/NADH) large chain